MNSLKNQYLKEMGVDVWVPRTRNPLIPIPRPAQPARTAAITPEAEARPRSSAEVPKSMAPAAQPFHLCFMTYRDVSLVFSVPVSVQSLPDGLRRFSDDLALAWLGQTAEPVIANLRWPMVQSRHIDQSEEAARAVVRQRLSQCGARVLLFGERASTYEKDCKGRTLKLDEIESYQAVPLNKRELWRVLLEFRSEAA